MFKVQITIGEMFAFYLVLIDKILIVNKTRINRVVSSCVCNGLKKNAL